ncbi:orotidine-5'-phosphate decarboxylase [Desulfobotulus sp.]|jgi:orotidine-5'-phosphate decarboxylase|uniref:orotidine-5'-phosphate decarboxylase n=1 Tax=Desulfobotulus sp. TaxID=1940337 RepID=UPI002A366C8C|nr:orotidine-5'-phosphate decarboxylase [Desulfobotulus sp.]MDY0163031.1 orotidine-5'-phosphate decarboxylase [Desulfobotulus sp.]
MPLSCAQRLIFALDFPDFSKALPMLVRLSGKVGVVKIGLELFLGEGPSIVPRIREKTDARIFLDLKLHDIPATVERSVRNLEKLGVDYLTLHTAGGREMLCRAREGAGENMALLGVTVLTSSSVQTLEETGCALEGERPLKTLVAKRAFLARESGLSGVICSGHEALEVKALCGPEFLAVTPGIRPLWSVEKKDDQERVMTPSLALAAGADMLVIGRPIRDAADPEAAVERILKEMADAG